MGLKLYIKLYIQGHSSIDRPIPAALSLSRSASAGISRDTGDDRDSNIRNELYLISSDIS